VTRSCLKSIRDKGPNKVGARHKTYSPVRQLGGHSWDHCMPRTHTHNAYTHPMHLWVGEAIMPQITTWLIVSEQMSRLSEIWAWLVRTPPPSPSLRCHKMYWWSLASRAVYQMWPRGRGIVKKKRLTTGPDDRKCLRCSLLCKFVTRPHRINNEIDLFL